MDQTNISYPVKPIMNAIVMLTNQCNCRCEYCFEARGTERMTFDISKDVLNFLHSSGSKSPGFTFFGGEPMLEFDAIIEPLVEYSKTIYDRPTRFAMTTNGTLFTKERLDFFKANNIRFMLSMDGNRTAQSGNRPLRDGRNSFDVVMQQVPYILELWPDQSFRETLTVRNASSLLDDILFFEEIGCTNLMIVPDLFEDWSASAVAAIEEQVCLYEAYILKNFRCGRRPLLTHEYSMAFKRILAAHNFKNHERRRMGRCAGCNQCGFGVRGNASITPSGDIFGCHHISPMHRDSLFYIGNIYDGVDEWRVRRLVDAYDPTKVGNSNCATCGLDKLCDGGCAPNNYQINGDVHKVPEMYCIWNRLIADSAYRIIQAMDAEGNAMFPAIFAEGVSKKGW